MKYLVTVERKRTIIERAVLSIDAETDVLARREAHVAMMESGGDPMIAKGLWGVVPDRILHGEGYWTQRPYDLLIKGVAPSP